MFSILICESLYFLTLTQHKYFIFFHYRSVSFRIAKSSAFSNDWTLEYPFDMRLVVNTRYFNTAIVRGHLLKYITTLEIASSKFSLRVEVDT
jgi:hypothetical protein